MVSDSDKMRIARDRDGKPLPGGTVPRRDGGQWHPTETQVAALNYWQDRDYGGTVKEMTKEIGFARTTFYQWLHTPAFVSWWNEQLQQYFARQLPRVYSALIKEATGKADHQRSMVAAARVFLERYDKLYTPRGQRDVPLKGQMHVRPSNEEMEKVFNEIIARHKLDAAETPLTE